MIFTKVKSEILKLNLEFIISNEKFRRAEF